MPDENVSTDVDKTETVDNDNVEQDSIDNEQDEVEVFESIDAEADADKANKEDNLLDKFGASEDDSKELNVDPELVNKWLGRRVQQIREHLIERKVEEKIKELVDPMTEELNAKNQEIHELKLDKLVSEHNFSDAERDLLVKSGKTGEDLIEYAKLYAETRGSAPVKKEDDDKFSVFDVLNKSNETKNDSGDPLESAIDDIMKHLR